MKHLPEGIKKLLEKKTRHKAWIRVCAIFMAIAVFGTTYALILPAITLTRQTTCGKEEHTHTDECYTVSETVTAAEDDTNTTEDESAASDSNVITAGVTDDVNGSVITLSQNGETAETAGL